MDIPLEITPALLKTIDGSLVQSTAQVDINKVETYIVRVRFRQWLTSRVKEYSQMLPGIYGIEYATLGEFQFLGHWSEDREVFVKRPINSSFIGISKRNLLDSNQSTYCVIALPKLYMNHDGFLASFPLVTLDILVSIPVGGERMKLCDQEDVSDIRLCMPMMFERVLQATMISHNEFRGWPTYTILARTTTAETVGAMTTSLVNALLEKPQYIPGFRESTAVENKKRAQIIARQWLYWYLGLGASHLEHSSYCLLCLLFGHEYVSRLSNRNDLNVLMFLTVMIPECFASPDILRLVCWILSFKRIFFNFGNIMLMRSLPRNGKEPLYKRLVRFSDHVCNYSSHEGLTIDVRNEMRASLLSRCSMRLRGLLDTIDVNTKSLWCFSDKMTVGANAPWDDLQMGEFLKKLNSPYARSKNGEIQVKVMDYEQLVRRGMIVPSRVELGSSDAYPGNQFCTLNATQVTRIDFVDLLLNYADVVFIMTMHYQSQICSVQSCIDQHRMSFILVCPNVALAQQAKIQWREEYITTTDGLCDLLYRLGRENHKRASNPTMCDQSQTLPGIGDTEMRFLSSITDVSMIVMLHGEMYGIEHWISILKAYKMYAKTLSPEESTKRLCINLVTDPFMARPNVITRGTNHTSVYGTENIALQLYHCGEACVKTEILREPDFNVETIPFKAGQIFYNLTNGRHRYARSDRARTRLQRFVCDIVTNMWLGEEDMNQQITDDHLKLEKVYVHTGVINFTKRSHLAETRFKRHDYLMLDTGEMLSLFLGDNASQYRTFSDNVINRISVDTICECGRLALYHNCRKIQYDSDSPWMLHEKRNGVIENPFSGRRTKGPDSGEINHDDYQILSECPMRDLCGTRADNAGYAMHYCFANPTSQEFIPTIRGAPFHELYSCTRDAPIAIRDYVGPSPLAVYVNVVPKTTVMRFLYACSLSRKHVQIVCSSLESKVKKDEASSTVTVEDSDKMDVESNHSIVPINSEFNRATENYVMRLRTAKNRGKLFFDSCVDQITYELIGRIKMNRITNHPPQGFWLSEMIELHKIASESNCKKREKRQKHNE